MSLETIVNDLVVATDALHASVTDKRTVLDNAAQQAAASLTTTKGLQTQAAASAATAAAKATEATNNATQIAAYKTAAAALDTATTATAAVTNLLPDMLAKKDPARHLFRKKMPTLVLDFERQKCHRYAPGSGFGETALSSFMTFARNSTATYTGPDGLIKTAAANEPRYDYDPLTGECKGLLVEEQRTNLLPFGSTPSKWEVIPNTVKIPAGVVSPEANLGVVKLTGAVGVLSQHITVSSSYSGIADDTVVVGSVYVKPAELTKVRLYINTKDNGYPNVTFNLTTKSVISTANSTQGGVIDVGGGWLRCYAVCSVRAGATTPRFLVELLDNSGNNNFISDGTSGLYVWGAQLEAGAFPTSYIHTPATFTGRASTATYLDANGVVQTAASGVARSNAYDYDSDGVLRPIGLLLESSATNQLLYSEQFDNAAWGKYSIGAASVPVVTANYGAAPDGASTADRVVFALNGGVTVADKSELQQVFTSVVGTTYTQSVWLKTADASTKTLQLSFNGENPKLITVTGTWQRFSNTGTASDTVRGFRLCLRGTTGTSDSADLLIWGAQQGVGNYPTSYIATTSAQVTRAADTSTSAQATRVADDAKVDGANFSNFYNQTQGTLVARGYTADSTAVGNSGTSRTLSHLSGGADGVRVGMSNLCGYAVVSAGVEVAGSSSLGTWSSAQHALGVRIKKDDFAATQDGGTVSTDTSAATPRALKLQLGSNAAMDGWLNGHVSRISYYPQPFTNEELQAATSA